MATHPAETRAVFDRPAPAEARRAMDALYSATYEELRRLASKVKRNAPGLSITPTALVDEAWAKLASAPGFRATSRLHFKRIAARAMRQILVEAARRKGARRRGGGVAFVTFDESAVVAPTSADEVLALDAALEQLARVQPRQARMVELRFFAGLDVAQTAELLEISEATVLRDWRAVKAWLAIALREARR